MTVGERMRKARVQKGMTQQDVAEAIGTTYQNISQYERGVRKAKMATLYRIASVLDVNIWDLDEGYKPISWNDPIEDNAAEHFGEEYDECDVEMGRSEIELREDVLYISRPTGDAATDELRRQLHDLIDQLDDEDLKLMGGLMIKFKH